MTPEERDRDLRQAVDERLTTRITDAAERRDRRRERLAELHERRRHGLKARHRNKLGRLATRDQDTDQTGDDPTPAA